MIAHLHKPASEKPDTFQNDPTALKPSGAALRLRKKVR